MVADGASVGVVAATALKVIVYKHIHTVKIWQVGHYTMLPRMVVALKLPLLSEANP